MEKRKETYIDNLGVGASFEFAHSKKFRNLHVRAYSDCGTTIGGEIEGDDGWRPLQKGYVISNKTRVIPTQGLN